MGNGASISPEAELDSVPKNGATKAKAKGGAKPAGPEFFSQEDEANMRASKLAANAQSKTPNKQQQQQQQLQQQQQQQSKQGEEDDEDNTSPIEILLQFIPYYGQGDPSNDSIVRATLAGLSINDIDSKDEYGNTLLLLACQFRCEDLVRIMLGKGADPNAINSSGACCLHFACYRESSSFNIARVLLQNGSNPEVCEFTYGCTPLHYCAGTGDVEFCKLLLSHGAQIGTYDYYNYTCVDYAREAGMIEVATFLHARLEKVLQTQQRQHGVGSLSPKLAIAGSGGGDGDWIGHTDPVSGGKYYINSQTSECLWESDLRARQQQQQQAHATSSHLMEQMQHQQHAPSAPAPAPAPVGMNAEQEAWLIAQTARARLIGFLGKHDPARLVEVEPLLEKYRGKETEMLKQLCDKYSVNSEQEFAAFQSKLQELKSQANNALGTSGGGGGGGGGLLGGLTLLPSTPSFGTDGGEMSASAAAISLLSPSSSSSTLKKPVAISTDFELGKSTPVTQRGAGGGGGASSSGTPGGMDPTMVQNLINEARVKFEAQLEEERAAGRKAVSAKEGALAKLQSEVEALRKERTAYDAERSGLMSKLERAQAQGGEAVSKSEQEIVDLQKENSELKTQLTTSLQERDIDHDKLKSVEATLANLAVGHEEAVRREREAAEERAAKQRENEAQHLAQMQALEEKYKQSEAKLKADLSKAKQDWAMQEREMRAALDTQRRTAEAEMENINKDIAERKAQFAQELSAAQLEAEDAKKVAEETGKRADAAEAVQRQMQQEVMEARQIQHYNAQLHKDLGREQLARKRLHNEMEDLKGKIRVYVRIRPFSKSERERGCTEALIKDGKLSVLIKGIGGPDQKKTFDFDQVFGGPAESGNSQADVFRDTKHLIMSVVDGYNVCIFAYGQTGAGKSFTMIGAADIGNCLQENGDFDELAGITPRAVSELFRLLNERQAQVEYKVDVQMFQLYRDGLDDLLYERKKKKKGDKKGQQDDEDDDRPTLKITLAEHSSTGLVQVEGAVQATCETPGDVMRVFAKGSARRTTASTQMNAESSRSHLICSLIVTLKNRRNQSTTVGKLTLVDLAGSERVDKSGAEGDVLKEAQSINKSLSALGDVIAALTSGQQHVPYRNHPLTMLMSDSLGGNAKTLMFVNASPADYNNAESNSSLQFASRCKDITNAVSSGPGVQAAQMNALKKQLAMLKKSGGGKGGGGGLARPV